MAKTLSLLLIFMLETLALCSCEIASPDINDAIFINKCVSAHNKARSNVQPPANNMRYMTWDEDLAILARDWGRKCLFIHNPHRVHMFFSSVGENLWAGTSGSTFNATAAIQSWINEKDYYNYNTHSCTRVCGHYTQVVWAESYKVGCAVIDCPSGVQKTSFSHEPGFIFTCNYAPAGNYKGVRPYKQGRACSSCEGEPCQQDLCRNVTRDAPIRRISGASDESRFCIAVIIIRIVSIPLIFITVYIVQLRNPNIFAYIQ